MTGSADIVHVVDGGKIVFDRKRLDVLAAEVKILDRIAQEHIEDAVRRALVIAEHSILEVRKLREVQPRVAIPPGIRLSAIARAVLTRRAYRKHVMVAVSEMQAEYIEEIRAGNYRKARWVSIRGHALILLTLLRALLPARVRAFLSG